MDSSVLEKIDSIENIAQKVMNSTGAEKQRLRKEADRRIAEIDAEIEARSAEALTQRLDAMHAQYEKDLQKLESQAAVRRNLLDRIFREEADARVEEIVRQVIE